MPIKKVQYTYRGLNQDISKSKHPFEFYYSANNIRIISTKSQSTGSITNEKGNIKVLTLPNVCINTTTKTINYLDKILPYNNSEISEQINDTSNTICDEVNKLPICSEHHNIIGYSLTRNSIILFSTDNKGFDCIWEIKEMFNDVYDIKLLYCRNLGFSINNPIQSIFNYENKIIQKIYWVDGKNQLRFLNIKHSKNNGDLEDIININSTNLNIAGEYSLSQPIITQVTNGGNHTSGMIQYAYNLYKLNGSQTVISPLSELVALDYGNTLGGGLINDIVGASPTISINNIDSRYTHIKIYSIKYTSFNEIPKVSIISEQEIGGATNIKYFDDGHIIDSVSLSEFLFLGSNPFIPQHIQTKDNRMFASNLLDKPFLLDIDMRAYSHSINSILKLWNNVSVNNNIPIGSVLEVNTNNYNVPLKHDSINPNYDIYKYQKNGINIGGEGKFIKYEIVQKTKSQLNGNIKYLRFFKDNEIYRIGIELYNTLGQKSTPMWVADVKIPEGNLEGKYNTLKVELKPEFFNYINSLCLKDEEKPIGYKILRANRTSNDKTVLCQGGLTSMVCQTTKDVNNWSYWQSSKENRKNESDEIVKIPTFFMKGMVNEGAYSKLEHLKYMSHSSDDAEIFSEGDSSYKRQQSWQYTKMMQLHSPDILFNNGLSFNSNLKLNVRGLAVKNKTNIWHNSININSLDIYKEGKIENVTNFYRGEDILSMYGSIGPSRDDNNNETINMNFKQYYHDCSTFIKTQNNIIPYNIYGSPEITNRGQGTTVYNGNNKFKYNNTLKNFLTDRKKWTGNNKKDEDAITSINSYGSKCLTLVQGTESMDIDARKGLEDLWSDANISVTKGLLIADIVYPTYYLYVGNIYGGNTYEDKTRTSYIEIGTYKIINDSIIEIESPGDTFVQNFKVARLSKTDTKVISSKVMQLTEIIEFNVETIVNLQNRTDFSLYQWDSIRQPKYSDYHTYNRVYSQEADLIQNKDVSFKFKKINSFDTRIMSSKNKIPGETIDSFTDFLENEIIDLDGKYGAINAMINYRDELYTLQDEAVAHLTINPRAQIQGADGISIELGKGGILYDYEYLTTKSGTLNKWSVFNSPSGFYYLDILNKSWNKLQNGQGILNLTDKYGLHSYFENNINYNELIASNPLIKKGTSGGYDVLHNTAYLTVLQEKNNFTLNFNENSNSFESFHDYHPSIYINKGYKMLTTSPDINKLYEHEKGNYQTFYDDKFPSYIILQVNPESNLDCVFNNIEYKSEIYLNDIDQPQNTLTYISAWNEYQKTNRIPLKLSRSGNLRRKFRNWSAQIPREAGTRNRIRNPWIFLKLELDTSNNHKMILHDILIHYTV